MKSAALEFNERFARRSWDLKLARMCANFWCGAEGTRGGSISSGRPWEYETQFPPTLLLCFKREPAKLLPEPIDWIRCFESNRRNDGVWFAR